MRPPTPLELMAFADGELDEPRLGEVEAYLASHEDTAAGVARARAVSARVSDALRAHPDADLTDDVMAAVDRQRAAALNAPPQPVRLSARPPATAAARGATIVTIALFAAAAAVVLWWQASSPSRAPVTVASVAPQQATPPSPSDEGTSVSAVDFGSNHGAIFFVHGEHEASTPVVWVGEEAAP